MKIIYFITLIFPILALASPKDEKQMAEAYALFQKGAYGQAIEFAKKIHPSDNEAAANLAYFQGAAHAKMQAYDKAIPFYKKAESLGAKPENLHYDYGQALFATQKLKEASNEFKLSILRNFKVSASAYYVAYISQLLEDIPVAMDFYGRIQKLREDPDNVKQPALFQMAEIENERVSKIEKKEKKMAALRKDVLPFYKKVEDQDSSSSVAEQARAKIKEIEATLAQNPETMANGVPLPIKAYTLRLSEEITHDSNVTTTADDPVTVVSNKDSFISKTAILAKYQFNWRRRWSFTPEFNGSYTYHFRRSTPAVYSNDNVSIGPSLRNKYEHMSFGQPATALIEAEFNLALRDYLKAHKLPYYSRYWNFTLGERVKWLATGTTTLKFSIKLFESYNPEKNSYSPSASLQQNIKIFSKYDWSNTLTADYLHARNDVNDEKNYKIRSSVTFTKLFEKVDVTPSISYSIKDTMKQKGTRGNERNVNPSLALGRDIGPFDTSLEYAYTNNQSLDARNYEYTKHEFKFSAGYKF